MQKYVLMNKEKEVLTFYGYGGYFGKNMPVAYTVEEIEIINDTLLPYFLRINPPNINGMLAEWLQDRNGASHNYVVQDAMRMLKLTELDEFIRHTHAASLNDTFWIKEEKEAITWNEVSLYRKESFNETVSRYCLGEHIELSGPYDRCPEFLTSGSFRRGFKKEADGIYLYKNSSYTGLEVYSEILSYEAAKVMLPDLCVPYVLSSYDTTEPLCKCRFFTDENTGLVTYYNLVYGSMSEENIVETMKVLGYEEDFKRMLLFDAIVLNVDRHLNNFGFLVDNDTLELLSFAPVYDMNLALLSGAKEEDLKSIGCYIRGVHPRFGKDFTQQAKRMLSDKNREAIEKMRKFTFAFRGDEHFPESRVVFLENIIHRQAEGILSEEDQKTYMLYEDLQEKDNLADYKFWKNRAEIFKKLIVRGMKALGYEDYENYISTALDEQQKSVVVCIDTPDLSGLCSIDFATLSVQYTGKQFPKEVMQLISEKLDFWRNR